MVSLQTKMRASSQTLHSNVRVARYTWGGPIKYTYFKYSFCILTDL